MTIHAASWARTTATDKVHARDTRTDYDHGGGSDEFAGMLAGAVHSTAPKHEPKKAKEGTSELDKPEEKHEDDGDDKKKVRRARPRAIDAAANGSETVQTTSALDPELQAKLARVMARMRNETGHDVTVTETLRSQQRQDTLFAQGRETPGPIVTWTRNSKHTQGQAVDVVLEGGAGSDAYTALQRIANEEGLRTLGARDPGHLELPQAGRALRAAANDATSIVPAEPADATGPGQVSIARLAQVAQVAQVTVEKPAQVAQIAAVARPEIPAVTPRSIAAPAVGNTQNAQVAIEDSRGASKQTSADSSDKDSSKSGAEGENAKSEHRGYGGLAAAVALRDASSSHAPAHAIAGGAPVSGAERAAQIIAAYQDAPARPLSQITMNVDAGNGVTDKVQVSMRGSTLSAAIDTGDVRGAEVMRSRADELVRALSRDGIEVEALRVRAAAGTASAVPTTTASQSSSDTASHSRFERNQQWQQQDRQRPQDERRQQQRQQRGGRDQ